MQQREREGRTLAEAVRAVLLDPAAGHVTRAEAGNLLLALGERGVTASLLRLFFAQSGQTELFTTALTLELLCDRSAVPPLIQALDADPDPDRRHAAARALGWIDRPGRAAARALARCVADPSQPQAAREEAAESLAYVGNAGTIEALIAILRDPDVRLRFWGVFGLGGCARGDTRGVRALESMLDDHETPPGNWWSVGREALAMLGRMRPLVAGYADRLAEAVRAVHADPAASAEDRRWAKFYESD